MGIFDKKKQPEPPQQPAQKKWIYYVLLEDDDLEQIEAECQQINLYYDIEEREDGEVRIYFYKEDTDRAHEVMNKPRKKPQPKPEPAKTTSGVDALIGNAQGRSQGKTVIPDNPLTRATAAAEAAMKKPSVLAQLKQPAPQPAPPTDIENRWAEEKMAEELKQIEEEIQDADTLLHEKTMMDTMQIMAEHGVLEPEPEAPAKQRKKRKSLGRTNQIKTRLTDAEMVQFQRRLKKSGLAQGDFLRSAALTGQIVIEDHSVADVAMLDELAMIRAELGRQGGLLKMIIKPNEGQRELAPEEWAELIGAVRDMEKIKKRLSDLEVKVQHGNREAQDK